MDTLSLRLTHTYVGACSHLDKWRDIGSYTIQTSNTTHTNEDDPCDPMITIMSVFVIPDEPVAQDEIKSALEDTFTKSGCAHEYDCCGCRSFRATWVGYMHSDLWCVRVESSRNY